MITSDTVKQTELVVVDNPRQHGHLHQPEADDDHRGNRRPLRAADGFSRKLISICRFVNEAFEYRQENDFDIEPDAPFADVLKVELDAFSIFSSVSVSPRQPLICAQPVMPGFTLWRSM